MTQYFFNLMEMGENLWTLKKPLPIWEEHEKVATGSNPSSESNFDPGRMGPWSDLQPCSIS